MHQSNKSVLAQFEELIRKKVDYTAAREHQLHDALHGVVAVAYGLASVTKYEPNALYLIDCCGAAIASELILSGASVNIQLGEDFPTLHDVISTTDDLRYIASLDLTNEEQAREASRVQRTVIAVLAEARENGKRYK